MYSNSFNLKINFFQKSDQYGDRLVTVLFYVRIIFYILLNNLKICIYIYK